MEELNAFLSDRVVDLQTRSIMSHILIFYNIDEIENVKEIIHDISENQTRLEKANENVKIYIAHTD